MKKYTLDELAEFMDRRDLGELTINDIEFEEYVEGRLERKLNKKKDCLDLDK